METDHAWARICAETWRGPRSSDRRRADGRLRSAGPARFLPLRDRAGGRLPRPARANRPSSSGAGSAGLCRGRAWRWASRRRLGLDSPGADDPAPAGREASLSHGGRAPAGHPGGGGPRLRPVRLRAADAQRPQGLGLHLPRQARGQERRLCRGHAPARSGLRLPGLPHVHARLLAAPFRGGGDPRPCGWPRCTHCIITSGSWKASGRPSAKAGSPRSGAKPSITWTSFALESAPAAWFNCTDRFWTHCDFGSSPVTLMRIRDSWPQSTTNHSYLEPATYEWDRPPNGTRPAEERPGRFGRVKALPISRPGRSTRGHPLRGHPLVRPGGSGLPKARHRHLGGLRHSLLPPAEVPAARSSPCSP